MRNNLLIKFLPHSMSILKKKTGISNLYMICSVFIISVVGACSLYIYKDYKEGVFILEVTEISLATQRWKKARSNYKGVTINKLCTQNILKKKGTICGENNDGKKTNPFGGDWILSAARNPGLYTVTGTLPNDADIVGLADKIAPSTRGQCPTATNCRTIKVTDTSLSMTY